MKERNINLDLIRFFAIFFVISVHFLLHTGFYDISINGIQPFILIFFRTIFMMCVPLFLLLTGFLMNKKELSKKYYLGIIRVIFVYIVAKFFYLIVDTFYFNEINSFSAVLRRIFNFNNDYSWYVNMYIGLFLLIPFINLIYNNLKNQRQKQVLIFSLFILSSLATLSFKGLVVFPDWWSSLYTLTYYFIWAYMREYGFNIKKSKVIILLFAVILASTIFYYALGYNKQFSVRTFTEYGGPGTFVSAVLLFGLLLNLNISKFPKTINKLIIKVSEVSFGMYLFSYMIDKIIYQKFNNYILNMNERFIYYFLVVPLIFLTSFLVSFCVNKLYSRIIQPRISKLAFKE